MTAPQWAHVPAIRIRGDNDLRIEIVERLADSDEIVCRLYECDVIKSVRVVTFEQFIQLIFIQR